MRHIVVVGAGIGGLTAALALGRAGVRCAVVERSAALPGTGGGIQIPPNASAVLHRLGLAPALAGAFRPAAREVRRWADDTLIGRTRFDFPDPYYTVRRATLCRALLAAVRRVHGPDAVSFGLRCVGVSDRGEDVVVRLDDGTARVADAVVGADGLHSSVRAQLGTGPVRYSGHSVYRAVLPSGRAGRLAPATVVVWLGPGRHCVAYPVDDGGVNLVATVPSPVPPSRVREVAAGEVLSAYTGWHPAVRGLIALATRLDHHGLFDRGDLSAWHRGRVVLLGDAAHPMLPFVAQGAAQAIEDAEVLASVIDRPDAFARYEAARRSRVARLAELARAGAAEYHLPDGPRQRERDSRLAAAGAAPTPWMYAGASAPVGAAR